MSMFGINGQDVADKVGDVANAFMTSQWNDFDLLGNMKQFSTNPLALAGTALALAGLAIPALGGISSGVGLLDKADDVVDVARVTGGIDDMADVTKTAFAGLGPEQLGSQLTNSQSIQNAIAGYGRPPVGDGQQLSEELLRMANLGRKYF